MEAGVVQLIILLAPLRDFSLSINATLIIKGHSKGSFELKAMSVPGNLGFLYPGAN